MGTKAETKIGKTLVELDSLMDEIEQVSHTRPNLQKILNQGFKKTDIHIGHTYCYMKRNEYVFYNTKDDREVRRDILQSS